MSYSKQLPPPYHEQVTQTLINYYQHRDLDKVDGLTKELEEKLSEGDVFRYWLGMACFRGGTLHLADDRKTIAKRLFEKGIKAVNKIKDKDSETFALLSLLRCASLSTANKMVVAFNSVKASKAAHRALDLNPENPRAYAALAIHNFYTPEKYGGNVEVDKHLLKAIQLFDNDQPEMHCWGRETCYRQLADYYKSKGETTLEKECLEKAIEIYPNHHLFQRMLAEVAV